MIHSIIMSNTVAALSSLCLHYHNCINRLQCKPSAVYDYLVSEHVVYLPYIFLLMVDNSGIELLKDFMFQFPVTLSLENETFAGTLMSQLCSLAVPICAFTLVPICAYWHFSAICEIAFTYCEILPLSLTNTHQSKRLESFLSSSFFKNIPRKFINQT